MDELISKKTVLDALAEISREVDDGYGFDYAKWREYFCDLPSAKFATDTNVGTKLGTNLAEVGTDCISRQAAIDAIDVLCQEHRYKIPGKGETYSQYNEAWQDALDRAEGAIFNLPSAQPEPLQPWEVLAAQAVLSQPEIIYCKDCKHWIPYDWMFSEVWQSKNMADYPEDEIGCNLCDMAMKANDFCSRAERREETT